MKNNNSYFGFLRGAIKIKKDEIFLVNLIGIVLYCVDQKIHLMSFPLLAGVVTWCEKSVQCHSCESRNPEKKY